MTYQASSFYKEIYYKIDISLLKNAWVECSEATGFYTVRRSVNNYLGNGTQYVMLKFREHKVPIDIIQIYEGQEMTQEEALAEVAGGLWKI